MFTSTFLFFNEQSWLFYITLLVLLHSTYKGTEWVRLTVNDLQMMHYELKPIAQKFDVLAPEILSVPIVSL